MMEHETREKAKNAVKLILEAAGFEVEEVDDPLDLSAVRDDEYVAVLCSVEADTIAEFDRTNYDIIIGGEQVPCKNSCLPLTIRFIRSIASSGASGSLSVFPGRPPLPGSLIANSRSPSSREREPGPCQMPHQIPHQCRLWLKTQGSVSRTCR